MSKRIMIVDDAEYMREMLEEIIETYDASNMYEIVGVAADGVEAITKYRELMDAGKRPDVVTLDIVMPNMDGVVVINELKKHDPDVNVIAISALGSPDTIDRVMQAGAKEYIIKPFSVDDLMDTIRNVCTPDAGTGITNRKLALVFTKENVLSGTISASEDGEVVVAVGAAAIDAISNYHAGEQVKVHIDPANIELQKHPDTTKNHLKGKVAEIIQSSPVSQVKLDCGFKLAANVPSKTLDTMHLSVGDPVFANFGPLAVHVKR
ncbi:MAG: response regulator [Euryarchaeota archaeon]|nr:response regulator [Euryarchaeota archaeon]